MIGHKIELFWTKEIVLTSTQEMWDAMWDGLSLF